MAAASDHSIPYHHINVEPMHAALNKMCQMSGERALLDDAFGSMDSEVAERKTALPLKETSAATANVVNNVVTD